MTDPADSLPIPPDLEQQLLRALEGPERAALVVPGRFGPYQLLQELGRGGMGCVYLAEHTALGRRVALKVIQPELLGSAELRRRFAREVLAAARLDHPHLCRVYEAGEIDGRPFMTMQWIQGETLAAWIAQGQEQKRPVGRREIASLLALFAQVAEAVHAAHGAGLIHRDLKPANVMVTEAGEPVVLDFGLARVVDAVDGGLSSLDATPGTPLYMAPEQIEGRVALDRRVDVYALGLVLYECLTLRRPFAAGPVHELQAQILTGEVPRPRSRNRAVPADLEAVLECALAKDRDQRYATAGELAAELRRVSAHEPVRARRANALLRAWRFGQRHPAVVTVMGVLLVALAVSGGLAWSLKRARQRERDGLILLADANISSSLRAGDWTVALAAMAEASALRPSGPQAVAIARVIALIGLGRIAEAQAALDRGSPTDGGTNPSLLLLHAEFAAERGQQQQLWRKFVQATPNGGADLDYAQAMLAEGSEVARLLDAALQKDPRHLLANTQRILTHAGHGEAGVVVDLARRQQAMMPEAPLFQFAECLGLAQQGRFDAAEQRLEELGGPDRSPTLALVPAVVRLLRTLSEFLDSRTLGMAFQVHSWGAAPPGRLAEVSAAMALAADVGRVVAALAQSGLPIATRGALSGLVPPLPKLPTRKAVAEWFGQLPEARLRALATIERFNGCGNDLACLVRLARELLDSLDEPGFLRCMPAARRFVLAGALLTLRGVLDTPGANPARDDAIVLLCRAVGELAAAPDLHPPLAKMAGDAAVQAGHDGLQVPIGTALLRSFPKAPWGPFLLARAEARSGRPAAARYWCQRALELDPQFAPATEFLQQAGSGK